MAGASNYLSSSAMTPPTGGMVSPTKTTPTEFTMSARSKGRTKKEEYAPEGFKTADDYLDATICDYRDDVAYDRTNREAALEDLKFLAGDQWDPLVLKARRENGRPCLTINVLPQFIGQVIGDRRINKTSIKVAPRKNSTVNEAELRNGIIKSIEAYSRAERVYDAACEDQVGCGIGNFRIMLDYADDDVFEQDIFIRHIPNPLAVVWDRMAVDPTGRDARHCFVTDTMPRKEYEKSYPNNPAPSDLSDDMADRALSDGWFDKDTVRIVEHWRLIERQRVLALMQNGKTEDVTDKDPAEYMSQVVVNPRTGQQMIREASVTYAQMHLITGSEILDGPYELKITRLPIIRVMGREIRVGEDRVRFGLVRFAKDSQRLKNYWRSTSAEVLALAPKAQWFGPAKTFEGYEQDFRDAHRSGDPILRYNDKATVPPQRVEPPNVNAAVLQEAQMNQQDIKDTTGLQDASLGVRSNEISGRAIQARQQEGDVATVIYHDNLNAAIQEGGDVINQLIPVCYDTLRELRVIGADDEAKVLTVNDPNDDDAPDITDGKYDVSVITGPSYTTQRMQAADAMMQAIQVAPQLMQIAGDIIVEAQDWPGAQKIAARLKNTVPPQVLSPEEQQAKQEQAANDPQAQQQQQQQQQAQQLQQAEIEAQLQHAQGIRKLQLETELQKSIKAQADAQTANANSETAAANTREANAKADKAESEAHSVSVEQAHRHAMDRRGATHRERVDHTKVKQQGDIAQIKAAAGSQPSAGRSNAQLKKDKK